MKKLKPFVKWVGGKRQILDMIKEHMPRTYNTYFEPFIGGGALFLDLAPKDAVINDYNGELINVYNVLKNDSGYNKMCALLDEYEKKNSEEFYYELRSVDRNKKQFNEMKDYERASRTIFLNKTCFNGLYRVNSKNEFNVPYNKTKKVNTYDIDNIANIHNYLVNNNITIMNVDFEEAVRNAKKGDFVYFDPPYDTLNDSFTSYTDADFTKGDQKRLFECYKKLDKKGVKVMLSNHNTPFINELYKNYNITVIYAKRSVNSNGRKRGNVEETIITNY